MIIVAVWWCSCKCKWKWKLIKLDFSCCLLMPVLDKFSWAQTAWIGIVTESMLVTALFMFTSLVASSPVLIEDRKTSSHTVSKSSTVLAHLTEKVLHWADRLEDMSSSPQNSTVLGHNLTVLGPLLKNYIDLVPSVSACTGALLGCHFLFFEI